MIAPTMYSLESYEPAIINDPEERKKVENNLRRALTSTKDSQIKYNVNLINRFNMNNQLAINNNITNKNQIYNNVNSKISIKVPANNQRVFPLLIRNIQNNQIFANMQNNNLINPKFRAIQYNSSLAPNNKFNKILYRNNNTTTIYRNPNIVSIMGTPNKAKNIQYLPTYVPTNNYHQNNIYNHNYKKPFYQRKLLYPNRK